MTGHMNYFVIRKSLWGRTLGISSSGGLVMGVGTTDLTLQGSSDVSIAAQMWGPGMVSTYGTSGTTDTVIPNHGVTFFSTGSTVGANYYMAAPVKGLRKTIIMQGSATGVVISFSTAGTVTAFASTLAIAAANGATSITMQNAATNLYSYVELVGLSTILWAVTSKSAGVTT